MEGPAFRLLQDPLLCVYHRDRQLMGAAIDIAQLEAGLLAWAPNGSPSSSSW